LWLCKEHLSLKIENHFKRFGMNYGVYLIVKLHHHYAMGISGTPLTRTTAASTTTASAATTFNNGN
jgi:hypothetical protein